MLADDRTLYEAMCALLVVLLALAVLLPLVRRVDARLGTPLAAPLLVAFGLRCSIIAVVAVLGDTAYDLRGTDDFAYLDQAQRTAAGEPTGPGSPSGILPNLLLALQIRLLGAPGDAALRVLQVVLAVAGIGLLALAVHELSGRHGAALTAWILALEPSNAFFSTLLHKESPVLLGEGLVIYGAARFWRRGDRWSLLALVGGCGIVAAARPYAGAFTAAGAGLVVLHGALRRVAWPRPVVAAALAAALLAAGAGAVAAAPTLSAKLDELQAFQERRAVDANLELEHVDFTTVSGVITGVPRRIRDLLARPYPWQRENLSQQLGSVGTVVGWALMLAVIGGLGGFARRRLSDVLPLVYPLLVTVVAYALTTANAGTGFRHRTHVLFLLAGLAGIVWSDRVSTSSTVRRVRGRIARLPAGVGGDARLRQLHSDQYAACIQAGSDDARATL